MIPREPNTYPDVIWWNRYLGFVCGPYFSREEADDHARALAAEPRPLHRVGEAVCTDFRIVESSVGADMGDCELCGHWDGHLKQGACPECRDKHQLDGRAAQAPDYGGQPLGDEQAPHVPDYTEATRHG